MPNGMASDSITYKCHSGLLTTEMFSDVLNLYAELFEDADLEFFKNRFVNQPEIYSVLAYYKNMLVGLKIGYPIDAVVFYSWIGGIKLNFRKKGIGSQLAILQENWAMQEGFKKLKTKSMNCFKSMMILNLKNGFDITKIYTNEKGQTKVVFEKLIV